MGLLIDLSSNNGAVDMKRVAAAGIDGAFVKATEALTYRNPYFTRQRADCAAVGMRFGAYHFARPDRNPFGAEDEAEHFCDVVGRLDRRDLKPVLDLEVRGNAISDRQLEAWARAFNGVVRRRLGVYPLFYSYPAFITDMGPDRPIGNGLWLASFGRNDGIEHPYTVPAPWKRAVAHQFTSRAHVAGVQGEVDLSSYSRLTGLLARPIAGLL